MSPTPLNEAISWADAERPQHLLYILSTYPTNPARRWLEDTQAQKAYGIHVLAGKDLAEQVAQFPDLVERYFYTDARAVSCATQWAHGADSTSCPAPDNSDLRPRARPCRADNG